jgi:uncharacterized repeat protein (TIGR03803 family)
MGATHLRFGARKFFVALLLTLVAMTSRGAANEKVLHDFVAFPHGANSQGNLIADLAGNLYGTTPDGGRYGYGTVFQLAPSGHGKWTQTVLYSFAGGSDGSDPVAGLVFDSGGNLYGTTAAGGSQQQQCITYRIGCGVVFELSPSAHGIWTEKVLYSFNGDPNDGETPLASLIFDHTGHLYGTTGGGGAYEEGTVFELTPGSNGAWTETILYDFTGGADGASPEANLVSDSSGNLYGTTEYGGDLNCNGVYKNSSCGTVFKLTPNANGTWTESVLFAFTYDDGAYPSGGLVFDSTGNLYGTTPVGPGFACDQGGCGTVFRLTPSSNGTWTQTMIYIFEGGPDGADPVAGLVFDAAGNLYGTTESGGLAGCYENCGTVFELMPKSKGNWTEKVIHRFGLPGQDQNFGVEPVSSIFVDQAGNLYGTTETSGTQPCNFNLFAGCGAVFELSPGSGDKWTASLLYSFNANPLGSEPGAGVVSDVAGNLYGTTEGSGISNSGVAFELMPQADGSWKEVLLHGFLGGRDGAHPGSSLIFDNAGNLYGTTTNGGSLQCSGNSMCGGIVFELSPTAHGWKESVLYRFGDNNNLGLAVPMGGLVLDSSGNLYGATPEGGSANCRPYGCGTVYKLSPVGGGQWREQLLYRFQGGSDGSDPLSTLVFDQAGNLYGTTCVAGVNGNGTVFKLAPNANGKWKETVLYSFRGSQDLDGSCPLAGVTFDRNGNLFGTTFQGGNYTNNCYDGGCGIVFELSPVGTSGWKETVLHRFHGGLDGSNPKSSLAIDEEGRLYGATPNDGTYYFGGAVFRLTRGSGGTWVMDILQHFKYGSKGGSCPVGPLIFDAASNIYGAASCGGTDGNGTIFQLSAASAGEWVDDLAAPPAPARPSVPPYFKSVGINQRFARSVPPIEVRDEK